MRRLLINILIVCLYCFPFVYFSMYQDFTNGSLIGYLVMIAGTSILAFFSMYFSNIIPFIIGNIASAAISFYFLNKMEVALGANWDSGYFKPLSPHQLLWLVSFLNLIPQLLIMKLAKKIKNT